MTVHHHILARRCWVFDLDGTLTVPVHDFPVIRTALGMMETDSDILTRNTREIALHTLGQIGLKGYFTTDDILGRDEAAPKPHPEGIGKLLAA